MELDFFFDLNIGSYNEELFYPILSFLNVS